MIALDIAVSTRSPSQRRQSSPVNTPHKCICRQEAHRPSQQAVYCTRQEAVAEEKEARDEALDVELGEVVPRAVEEDPNGAPSPDEE